MEKLDRTFYARPAEQVALELIGATLVRRHRGKFLRARIVETEAYVGEHDLACHASKGRTGRTEIMFGPPGVAYVYLIYGMHDMLNVVCAGVGDAQAVLVRAAEPLDDFRADLSGPGKLCRALHVTRRRDNGTDVTGDDLFITFDPGAAPPRILRTPRIGVGYARDWTHAPLRFVDAASRAVSGPKRKRVSRD